MPVGCLIFSSVGCPVYFPHYLINGIIFGEKSLNIKKNCFDFLYNFFFPETLLILRRNERDMIKIVYWTSCKVPVIVARFE